MDGDAVMALLQEVVEKLGDFRTTALQKAKAQLEEAGAPQDHGDEIVDYLECKQQMLLAYCQNLVFYLSLKARGESVAAHPVMNQLLELRFAMEKLRPIDGKLHYQIDRLVKLASMDDKDAELSSLRPNPLALLAKDQDRGGRDDDDNDDGFDYDYNDENDDDENDDEDESDDDESNGRRKKKLGGTRRQDKDNESGRETYRAPRMVAVPFKEREDELARRDSRLQKTRRKLKNSEILDTLREEFSTAPDVSSSSGISGLSGENKQLAAEEAERRGYEEDRFVRMTMSRKDKQDIRRRTNEASRLDNMNDLGDFGSLDELTRLAGKGAVGKGMGFGVDGDNERLPKKGGLLTAGGSAKALHRAVTAFRTTTGSSAEGLVGKVKKSSMRSRDDGLADFKGGVQKKQRKK